MKTAICDDIEIEYGPQPEATRRFGLKRGMLYLLDDEGSIKSKIVRRKGSRGAGIRLFDFNSIRQYFAGAPDKTSKEISKVMRRRAKLPRKQRNGHEVMTAT
jgi:hypothetical protein